MHFSSTLLWFFAVEHYDSSIKTINDLFASGMELGVDIRTHNYFKDHFFELPINDTYDLSHKGRNRKKMIFCNSTSVCLSRIVSNR